MCCARRPRASARLLGKKRSGRIWSLEMGFVTTIRSVGRSGEAFECESCDYVASRASAISLPSNRSGRSFLNTHADALGQKNQSISTLCRWVRLLMRRKSIKPGA